MHAGGARAEDVVLVTSEAILTALLAGRLTVQAALDRGVLIIDGPSSVTEIIRQLLTTGLGHQSLGSPPSYFLQTRVRGRLRFTIGKHGSPWTPTTARD